MSGLHVNNQMSWSIYKSIDKNRIDFRNTNEQNHCAYQILQKTPALFISRREKSKQQLQNPERKI